MQIPSMGAELFQVETWKGTRTDGQTDRHEANNRSSQLCKRA